MRRVLDAEGKKKQGKECAVWRAELYLFQTDCVNLGRERVSLTLIVANVNVKSV